MSDDDTLDRIAAAAAGLSYPSERDAPLIAYHWEGEEEPTPEGVCAAAGKPEETSVSIEPLDAFFEGLTDAGEGASERDLADAAAWRRLQEILASSLTDVRVYWCGQVDVAIHVLGRGPRGGWIGIHTSAVET